MLAIKIHDIDENVQILENAGWSYEGSETILPIPNLRIWELER